MKYYIQRQLQEYGPYTLADLQRYVAQGNILPTDLTRGEGMTEWVPVSQVLANIPPTPPVAVAPMPGGTVYAGGAAPAGTVYAGPATPASTGPIPPDLHWALVLLIGFFCGIFQLVWLIVEAVFIKKIRPASNCLAFLITGIAIQFGAIFVYLIGIVALAATTEGNRNPPAALIVVFFLLFLSGVMAGAVFHIVGVFKMRRALLNYYNMVEPINLRLSGVMTFFFNVFYFQYHFTRIAVWKRTGYLEPQQLR